VTLQATAHPANERTNGILEAACRVIVREGAHGLRMASVAEEADVSKALVHYYFATRRELLRNALLFAEARWERGVAAELAELTTGAARLERVLLLAVDPESQFAEQRAIWNEIWSTLRSDEELRPLADGYYRNWLDRVITLAEQGRADGSIPRAVQARGMGLRLAAAADGFDAMLYLGLVTREDAAHLLRECIRRELAEA
jgi:AcrR family transcriptional regulator